MLSTLQHFIVPVTTVPGTEVDRLAERHRRQGPGAADASMKVESGMKDSTDDLSNVTRFVMLALAAGGARVSLCREEASLARSPKFNRENRRGEEELRTQKVWFLARILLLLLDYTFSLSLLEGLFL
ncbi:hypothetical protein ACFX11_043767 [Malus domestica]